MRPKPNQASRAYRTPSEQVNSVAPTRATSWKRVLGRAHAEPGRALGGGAVALMMLCA